MRLTFAGGSDGIVGQNCLVVESDNRIAVLDCGVRPLSYDERKQLILPRAILDELRGREYLGPPPNMAILDEILRRSGKKAFGAMSHAHYDHIGAVRELGKRHIPVLLSRKTKALMERSSDNLLIPRSAKFQTFDGIATFQRDDIEITFFPVPHSIPGTCAVLLKSDNKSIVYLSDFKFNGMQKSIEQTKQILQEMRRRAGKVNCLVMDVINAEIEGFTPPEHLVLDAIDGIVKNAHGRVFVTFFASNIDRMEGILRIADAHHRKVGVLGHTMRTSYMYLTGRDPESQGDLIIVGGSQGEENSSLARLARGEHNFQSIGRGDILADSSRVIPNNEEGKRITCENMHDREVEMILHEGEADKLDLSFRPRQAFLHVSGHEQRGGQREAISIIDPDIVVPFHAPEDRYEIFRQHVGGARTKRLHVGETLTI